MDPLEWMVGRWAGTSWTQRDDGKRVHADSTETVELRLGGSVLVIEGAHYRQDGRSEPSAMVFNALAVVSFDISLSSYQFTSFTAKGDKGDFDAVVSPDDLTWIIPIGKARSIKYVVAKTADGEWLETGHIGSNLSGWNQTFEMILSRTDDRRATAS